MRESNNRYKVFSSVTTSCELRNNLKLCNCSLSCDELIIPFTIGDEFDEMDVNPTMSLKNIVTLSKLSAMTYFFMSKKNVKQKIFTPIKTGKRFI